MGPHPSIRGSIAWIAQAILRSSDAAEPFARESGCMSAGPNERSRLGRKAHELEQIADVGESDRTPLILIGEVWVVAATAVLVVLALALLAYDIAAR